MSVSEPVFINYHNPLSSSTNSISNLKNSSQICQICLTDNFNFINTTSPKLPTHSDFYLNQETQIKITKPQFKSSKSLVNIVDYTKNDTHLKESQIKPNNNSQHRKNMGLQMQTKTTSYIRMCKTT